DKEPASPDADPLDFGDLDSSPGLSEYSEFASKGATYLIRLATELESRGEFERALLAWERVIDSCPAEPDERQSAEAAVLRLRPTLPRWNIDPAGEIPILLQLGTGRKSSEGLTEAVREAAEFLRRDSGDLCAVTPRLTTAAVSTGSDDGPIAVYLSGTGEAESNQSSVVSVNPESNAMEPVRRDILIAVYRVLREQLTGVEGIRPPSPPSHPDTPEDDYLRHLTRLHWQYAAERLAQTPKSAAP
ncbi:MAG: hypothetical protein HKO57_13680, partial [Akkermansiaceae bacterium]|nr:hypothetical protein [Akkermansiaceae bacterium]